MFEYHIIREYADYKVIDSTSKTIFTAKNITSFFGPEKFIYYDVLENEIGRYFAYHFLGIGFLHKIKLVKGETVPIRGKINGLSFKYKSNSYQIQYIENWNDRLFRNNSEVGEVQVVSKGVSVWEHKISCRDKESCFIFSMVDIALNNFDIN